MSDTTSKSQVQLTYTLDGSIKPTANINNISDLVTQSQKTPGSVGVCFSGGGSVAMMAALGQIRALSQIIIESNDNNSAMGSALAVSTVSGGSWATVPFIFLPDAISDDVFLGPYVADQSTLTMDGSDKPTSLKYIPKGYMGSVVASDKMKWTNLGTLAANLYRMHKFPNNRIWNYIMARHVLEPLQLAETKLGVFDASITPSGFAYDADGAKAIKPDGDDADYKIYTYQGLNVKGRINRPFHLCNTSMFIYPNEDSEVGTMLAPVQSTATMTGILADNLGTPDSNELGAPQVGGGMVDSYLMDSQVRTVDGDAISVSQEEPFSLADITANSSAFYATMFKSLSGMDPAYKYFPVKGIDIGQGALTPFADGGAIENNGIVDLLAFDDVKKVISFVNALATVYLAEGTDVTPQNIVVDQWLPPLFGYTPYQSGKVTKKDPTPLSKGYHLYSDLTDEQLKGKGIRFFRHNQVFRSDEFFNVIQDIYNSANPFLMDSPERVTNGGPAVYHNPSITVVQNDWFNVSGADPDPAKATADDRTVELLLFHYNPYAPWTEGLDKKVQKDLDAFVKETQKGRHSKEWSWMYGTNPNDGYFPNFMLTQTHMPDYMVNIFAHFTAAITMTQKDVIKNMFTDS